MSKKVLVLLLIFALLFAVSCKKYEDPVEGEAIDGLGDVEMVKIISSKTNVKAGCSANENTLKTANQNDKLKVISKVNDWYAVKLPDNQIGFVPVDQCKPIVDDGKDIGKTPISIPGKDQIPGLTPTPGTTPAPPKTPGTTPGTTTPGTTPATPTTPEPDKPTTGGGGNGTLTSLESEMLKYVNEARSANGVAPLKMDSEVTNVARIKSQDMIDNNYFSHNSPTYGSPFDMLKSFGIKYISAGENIAGNSSVKAAHDALMKSEGHRKNILNPNFTHIGIGIKKGGQYGNMFTQLFIGK